MNSSRRLVCSCVVIVAAACGLAHAQNPDSQFQAFFSSFKDAVRANDVQKLADALHFPFYLHSFSHTRAEFVGNKDESVNFFNRSVRSQILRSTTDDLIVYRNRQELGEPKPDFALIPANSPVIELDIVNERGGPALRLVFAKIDSSYKLFCVTQ